MLILRPPAIVQFTGNYSAWAKREAELAAAQTKSRAPKKPESKPTPPAPRKRSDNPWNRPFGRLTLKELEKQITETEIALADCQNSFSNPATSRDSQRSKQLSDDFAALGKKLKQLEEEYYAREA